jgi:hypothetical protein
VVGSQQYVRIEQRAEDTVSDIDEESPALGMLNSGGGDEEPTLFGGVVAAL